MIWALDASVAVKWFFTDESRRPQAMAVRGYLTAHPECFVVPHLFMSELVHVLARKSGHDAQFVENAIHLLLRLGLRTLGLDDDGWRGACRWSARGLSGYDATYVALAEQLGGCWLTDDGAAAQKAPALATTLAAWTSAP